MNCVIEELKMCGDEMEGLGGLGSGRGGERIYKLKCGRLDTKTLFANAKASPQ